MVKDSKAQTNPYCKSCEVSVSDDLKHCPLCGRFVRTNENTKPKTSGASYPTYDFSYIYQEKFIRVLGDLLLLAALIATATNLVFWTEPLWFPYVITSIVTVYYLLVHPFKNDENYLKSVSLSTIIVALFIIFIDLYNSVTTNLTFGWSITFVAPFVLCFGSLTCGLIALFSRKYDIYCLQGLFTLLVLSILFLTMKFIWFKDSANWPSYMFTAITVGMFVLIFIFKSKKLKSELNKNFHM